MRDSIGGKVSLSAVHDALELICSSGIIILCWIIELVLSVTVHHVVFVASESRGSARYAGVVITGA